MDLRSRVLFSIALATAGVGACSESIDRTPHFGGSTGGSGALGPEGGAGGEAPVDCREQNYLDNDDCIEWTVCVPGEYIVFEGSLENDRLCAPCEDSSFTAENNTLECKSWDVCEPGEQVEETGTSSRDRECKECEMGTFSVDENVQTCTPWTPCPPFYVPIIEGRDFRDQTCDLVYPARVSLADGRRQLQRESGSPSVSNNGKYIFFDYPLGDLAPGDTNNLFDGYRVDFTTGEATRVTVGDEGQEGNHNSDIGAISPSGNLVLFNSVASNLINGDENGRAMFS